MKILVLTILQIVYVSLAIAQIDSIITENYTAVDSVRIIQNNNSQVKIKTYINVENTANDTWSFILSNLCIWHLQQNDLFPMLGNIPVVNTIVFSKLGKSSSVDIDYSSIPNLSNFSALTMFRIYNEYTINHINPKDLEQFEQALLETEFSKLNPRPSSYRELLMSIALINPKEKDTELSIRLIELRKFYQDNHPDWSQNIIDFLEKNILDQIETIEFEIKE